MKLTIGVIGFLLFILTPKEQLCVGLNGPLAIEFGSFVRSVTIKKKDEQLHARPFEFLFFADLRAVTFRDFHFASTGRSIFSITATAVATIAASRTLSLAGQRQTL
jgi:hypothetical protein